MSVWLMLLGVPSASSRSVCVFVILWMVKFDSPSPVMLLKEEKD